MTFSDWIFAVNWIGWIVVYILFNRLDKQHLKEIERIHLSYKEERQELLDRIMANNIHEYKAHNGNLNVKKSETGNFLVDRMERSVKSRYPDME